MADDPSSNCVFCMISNGKMSSKKVYEDKNCLAVLDITPANEGHIILFPKKHYAIMPHMPQEELSYLFFITKRISQVLLQTGFGKATTILIQNGGGAGQRVGHFSINIIPRKKNDLLFKTEGKPATEDKLIRIQLAIVQRLTEILGRPPITEEARKAETKKEIAQKNIEEKPVPQKQIIIQEKECDHILNPPKPYSKTKEKVAKLGLKKENEYLYFVDKEGDVSRAKMQRKKKDNPEKAEEKNEADEEQDNEEETDADEQKNDLDNITKLLLRR